MINNSMALASNNNRNVPIGLQGGRPLLTEDALRTHNTATDNMDRSEWNMMRNWHMQSHIVSALVRSSRSDATAVHDTSNEGRHNPPGNAIANEGIASSAYRILGADVTTDAVQGRLPLREDLGLNPQVPVRSFAQLMSYVDDDYIRRLSEAQLENFIIHASYDLQVLRHRMRMADGPAPMYTLSVSGPWLQSSSRKLQERISQAIICRRDMICDRRDADVIQDRNAHSIVDDEDEEEWETEEDGEEEGNIEDGEEEADNEDDAEWSGPLVSYLSDQTSYVH